MNSAKHQRGALVTLNSPVPLCPSTKDHAPKADSVGFLARDNVEFRSLVTHLNFDVETNTRKKLYKTIQLFPS